MIHRRIKSGETLFCEGDGAGSVFEVVEGILRLSRLLPDGRRQIISFAYPGDVVGFQSSGRYENSCEALTETKLKPHRLDMGETAVSPGPTLIDAALREISNMQAHFVNLGCKTAKERVASFLTELSRRTADSACICLPMSRADIGDYLGLTAETVSRIFTALREQAVIALDTPHSVRVLDRDRLLAMAGLMAMGDAPLRDGTDAADASAVRSSEHSALPDRHENGGAMFRPPVPKQERRRPRGAPPSSFARR